MRIYGSRVSIHPFVVGELACGNPGNRVEASLDGSARLRTRDKRLLAVASTMTLNYDGD